MRKKLGFPNLHLELQAQEAQKHAQVLVVQGDACRAVSPVTQIGQGVLGRHGAHVAADQSTLISFGHLPVAAVRNQGFPIVRLLLCQPGRWLWQFVFVESNDSEFCCRFTTTGAHLFFPECLFLAVYGRSRPAANPAISARSWGAPPRGGSRSHSHRSPCVAWLTAEMINKCS